MFREKKHAKQEEQKWKTPQNNYKLIKIVYCKQHPRLDYIDEPYKSQLEIRNFTKNRRKQTRTRASNKLKI